LLAWFDKKRKDRKDIMRKILPALSFLLRLLGVSPLTCRFMFKPCSLGLPAQRRDCDSFVSRSQFLVAAASTIVIAASSTSPVAAWAREIDPFTKGTKKDPEFEACLSKCLYQCTKPKGEEQKSRAECLPECKKSCATTKEQLLTGSPIKK
jgi:hypothetical protein